MPTKKASSRRTDDLRPEYDLSRLGPPVRGKYYERAVAGTNLVLLDPDVAKTFPTAEAVNSALRMLAGVAEAASGKGRPSHRKR